jgi:hypothetical protein
LYRRSENYIRAPLRPDARADGSSTRPRPRQVDGRWRARARHRTGVAENRIGGFDQAEIRSGLKRRPARAVRREGDARRLAGSGSGVCAGMTGIGRSGSPSRPHPPSAVSTTWSAGWLRTPARDNVDGSLRVGAWWTSAATTRLLGSPPTSRGRSRRARLQR